MSEGEAEALARLEADGLVRRAGEGFRTTRRLQAAMARAAGRLYLARAPDDDLRLPLASALVELYGEALTDAQLVDAVHALLPIEAAELQLGARVD